MAELAYGAVSSVGRTRGLVAPSVFVQSGHGERVSVVVPSKVTASIHANRRRIPTYLPAGVNALTANMQGIIRGRVREDGLSVSGRVVRAYLRSSGALVAEVLTTASGDFELTELYADGVYYVLALDDLSGPPVYNAVISDQVTTVLD